MVFPLACLAAAAIVLISEGAYWQSVGKLDMVGALSRSQDSVQRLTQGIVDAEAGSRGFLLTGNREYLEPYELAQGKIDKALELLGERFGADSASAAALDKLRDITRTRLSELALTIRLIEEGKVKAVSYTHLRLPTSDLV